MKQFACLSVLLSLLVPSTLGHCIVNLSDSASTNHFPIETTLEYSGDLVFNLHGGLKTGAAYLGLASASFNLNSEKTRLWKGGEFTGKITLTHGDLPSATLIGDFQIASNIEAGNHLFFQELFYRQSVGNISVAFGLMDMNSEFAYPENGSCFINSAFGFPVVIADNIPAPVFPLTSLALSGRWNLDKCNYLQIAIHDGNPLDFDSNPYNLKWRPGASHGATMIAEGGFEVGNNMPWKMKLGIYHHSGSLKTSTKPDSLNPGTSNNGGLYVIWDKTFLNFTPDATLAAFGQFALSPRHVNHHHFCVGGGLVANQLRSGRMNFQTGCGFSIAGFDEPYKMTETTLEGYLRINLIPQLYIQSDVQYIIHPVGTGTPLPNALIVIFRAGFSLPV